ncbi:uncharacterized protein LOC114180793 [Vigna unguiculata]|uniref:uncharacterized protein LOC114180793 n=1 Tax=Vigna unguiculata TaxID=3917 RepID=UPI0010161287|nr:uncharacterized protein LOC114180793 [Vigna unguiculata]
MANIRRNNELTEAMQAIRDMAAALMRNQRPEGNPESQGLAEFRRNKPPQFSGGYDPEKAELWIKEMEKIFRVMKCANNQKVNYVVFMLIGEAEYWWDGTRRLLEGGRIIITWDVFRTRFLEKYFPNDVRRAKEIEFMQLKQGSMIVGEYASKFLEDFENNQNIKPKYFGPQTNKNKRNEGKPYNRPQWRTQSNQSSSGNSSRPVYDHIRCFKCGQGHHAKDCHLKGPVCFKCGKPGHIFSECGQQKPHFNPTTTKTRPTTTGRVYTMTGAEAAKNHDLIQDYGQEDQRIERQTNSSSEGHVE